MPIIVHILLFPDVELLDFAGPHEVLTVARDAEGAPLFAVTALAPRAGTLRTRHGLNVVPDAAYADLAPPPARLCDVLIVPGGQGVRALLEDRATLDLIRRCADAGAIVASVCTGAWVLARAGLLDGRPATTHHLCLDRLRELAPTCEVPPERRVIDCGPVITSGGISAGIDMSLHLVSRLHGAERARWTARYMEYEQTPAAAALAS